MGCYTYFKVPVGYRSKGKSINDLKTRLKRVEELIFNYKLNLLAVMVQSFYKNSIFTIKDSFDVWLSCIKEKVDLKVAINYFDGDDNAAFNHADAGSEYELEEFIESYTNLCDQYLEDLVVLSNIKPEEKIPEYLRYDYINEINTVLKQVQEVVEDISLRQLWLDCFDTKKEEDGN